MTTKPNTCGKLALRTKSYLVSVYDFGSPGCQEWNYHAFGEAKKHFRSLLPLLDYQVLGKSFGSETMPKVLLSEVLRSKRQDKEIPPTKRFALLEGGTLHPVEASAQPKSYLVWVQYKTSWPPCGECVQYHYHARKEAERHLRFLFAQVAGQNGKDGVRKNVILSFKVTVCVRSVKTDNKLPPIDRFVAPKARKRPEGGLVAPPGM